MNARHCQKFYFESKELKNQIMKSIQDEGDRVLEQQCAILKKYWECAMKYYIKQMIRQLKKGKEITLCAHNNSNAAII